MSTQSLPLRLAKPTRRFSNRKAEATQQIITFRLQQEWFALPIQAVQRVVWLERVYGDPQNTGVSLTQYQNQDLLVIDVSQRIFGRQATTSVQQRYLAVVQNAKGDLVGLPLDSQPSVRRVPESSFQPIPPGYLAQGNVRCVSEQTVKLEQELFFLLDPAQLTQPQQITAEEPAKPK